MSYFDSNGVGLGGGVLQSIAKLFAAVVGWMYLWCRYRSRDKVKRMLAGKYNRSYAEAGGTLIAFVLQVAVLLVGLMMVGGFVYAVYHAFVA